MMPAFALVALAGAVFAPVEDVHPKGYAADRSNACYRNKVSKVDPMYFAREFRYPAEAGAWQGEFWGKCMLSAVPYAFWMGDDALKAKIAASVKEVIADQEPDGYIGNYPKDRRAGAGWDIWGNKYTLLGLLAWHERTGDKETLAAAERLAGYLMGVFGPGKRHLNETGCFRGLPSCSILEAVVKLYTVTGKPVYRAFAAYIVDEMDLAGRGPRLLTDAAVPPGERVTGDPVWKLSSRKAYEMMSCYQGLIAYAKAAGEKRPLEAAVKTAELIARDEINLVGGGASCENWFGGAARQTQAFMFENETCVITTWLRLCSLVLQATGDPKWADEIEKTFYNAYLGAQRPDGSDFVQYTSLCGRRHAGENQSRLFVNCCTANGPRGYLAFFGSALGADGDAVLVNQYVSGDASVALPGTGTRVSLETYADYPKTGNVSIRYRAREPKRFALKLRIPGWSRATAVKLNGRPVDGVRAGTYLALDREWVCGDQVDLAFDCSVRAFELNGHAAFKMGPLVLARDRRFDDGDLDEVIARHPWIPDPMKNLRFFPTRTRREDMFFTAVGLLTTGAHTKNAGEKYPSVINFCDYGSAGNTWTDESACRVWLPIEADPKEAPAPARPEYDSSVFNRAPKSEVSGEGGAFRLLIVGNSTSLHGPAPDIGWTNSWGMAASAKEKDYAHLLWRAMEKGLGVSGDCRIHNAYQIERSFFGGFRPDAMFAEDLAWKPDYVVFAIGENAPFDGRPEAEERWADALVRMGEALRRANPSVKLVIRTPFWFTEAKNRATIAAARRLGVPVADLGARGDDPAMKALDRGFAHKGVAGHPGDRGMRLMADAIFAALFDTSAVRVYALPEGDPRCDLYRVTVDGKEVPVSAARVSAMPVNIRWPGHQREKDQTEIAGFVRFEMSGPVSVTVDRARPFEKAKIRPYSKGVALKTEGRLVTFTLEKPGDYSLEFDGQHENLHVFAMPPSSYAVKKGDPSVRYFGPGIHEAGLVEMKSGETVYIDEGAVVRGRIFAKDADDIAILGRGILDMSTIHEEPVPIDPALAAEQKRKGFAITNVRRHDAIRLEYCDRVRIDGITLRDSLLYNVRPICCRDLTIRNVKIVGSWRYNADGIDMHNCERVRIADCFLRTYDDAICIKGFDYGMDEALMLHDGYRHDVFRDVRIERCTFWNDWGQSLELGAETRAREICGVVWRDCDVIRAHATACDIQNCDYADIHDVVYEDIRLEFDDFYPRTVLSATAKDFDPAADAGLPRAIAAQIHVVPEYSKNDRRRGRIRDIEFRNISVVAPRQPAVLLAGHDADHRVTDITIEGFRLNSVDITKSLKVDHGRFADAPTLKPASVE